MHPTITRREVLLAGALGTLGLGLDSLAAAENKLPAGPRRPARRIAKSCILFFLEGGPAHQDLWDLKPSAPAEVRGEFRPIHTSAPGIQVCEHLPLLAKQMQHVALVRSVHHSVVDHNAGAYYALTGRSPFNRGQLIIRDEPENFPPLGAICAKVCPTRHGLMPFVQIPEVMSNNGFDLPGQRAGFLGRAYDPFISGDPAAKGYSACGLAAQRDVALERLNARREILAKVDAATTMGIDADAVRGLEKQREIAFDLLCGPAARAAFNLDNEPLRVRERYGLPGTAPNGKMAREFGGLPHLGQSMLLARRLVEAGVRLVTVCTGRRFDQAWDTHRNHFALLRQSLLPAVDKGFSALLEDLDQRGLLEDTLIVAMGEFGRTPRVGQVTSPAGADTAGRDHWPHCYTVLMAGGPVKRGFVHGASDRHAAYPLEDAVTPEDITATIYAALGIEPAMQIPDFLGRPHILTTGRVLDRLFA